MNQVCVFLETTHPAKLTGVMEEIIRGKIPLPEKLAAFIPGKKIDSPGQSVCGIQRMTSVF
jgi:hypothetical protein